MPEWKSCGDGTFIPLNDAAKAIQAKRDKRDNIKKEEPKKLKETVKVDK